MPVVRVSPSDVDRAAPLFADYRVFYGEPYDLEAATAFLTERLQREESIVLIALEEETPVGFTQIYPSFSSTRLEPIWIVNDLFVSEASRGSGAVNDLLNTAATLAKQAGVLEVELATAHTNLRAQAVYDRHGYQLDEHYKHYAKPLA